jgi:hypothetical protein
VLLTPASAAANNTNRLSTSYIDQLPKLFHFGEFSQHHHHSSRYYISSSLTVKNNSNNNNNNIIFIPDAEVVSITPLAKLSDLKLFGDSAKSQELKPLHHLLLTSSKEKSEERTWIFICSSLCFLLCFSNLFEYSTDLV